ncbi:hypothetical protein F53441_4202 [Fusarium austroafricanum]|uniref:Membrane insertase YidC/Oxa/ALB C-terminal domain-containing protein n=1 Tax=Fusarium austroafricanum TaxID=2364996 RepID=A0A8H4P1W7_9HYPO|nr:hypothetical protein F53441_4202 [Fusarium austroafricanum]
MSDEHNHLADSGFTLNSDIELYSGGDDVSSPPSSNSPVILYKPPTVWSLVRGAAINLLLPFINGMMLGFGELFAHEAAFRLGWGGTKVFPLSRRRAHPIGPGIELRERQYAPRPSLDDIASLEPRPNDKVIRRPSAADYCEPDIYPPVPENLQKIPSNIAQLLSDRTSHLITAAMLPSRGIVRSLPSGTLQGPCGQSMTSRTLGRKLNARQFGTALRNARTPLSAGTRVGVKNVAAPVVLGGISSSRQLSLWGYQIYGKKKTEEPAVEATTTPEAPTPPEHIEPTPAINEAPVMPAETVSETTHAVDPSSVTPSEFDLNSIADLAHPSILTMPENIGFLSEIGLDYGWGPTSVMQWVLEHVHVYTGLGWGGSIIATALLLRAAMLYPQYRSVKFSAAMNKFKEDPRGKEAMELTKRGFQTQDREMTQKGQFLAKMVRQQYGAEMSNILWGLLQVPFSFGLFRVINGMIHIPVPSMEDAGYLWFTDLTAADPFYILPAVGTGLLISTLLVNGKYTPASQKAMMKNMMYVMGGVTFIGTSFLGAGVNLMMLSTGATTLATAAVFNNESVRRALDLPIPKIEKPVYEAPRASQATGLTGIQERLTDKLDTVKKGISDQMGNMTNQYSGTAEERAEKQRKEQIQKLEQMRRKLEREEFEKKYKR